VEDGRLVLDQLMVTRHHHHHRQQSNLCKELVDRKHFGCRIALATVVLETVIDESTQSQSALTGCCLLQWPPLKKGAFRGTFFIFFTYGVIHFEQ
jgi:hypothetical protein